MPIATKEREDRCVLYARDGRVDLIIAKDETHEPPEKKKIVTLGNILTENRNADTGSMTSFGRQGTVCTAQMQHCIAKVQAIKKTC